MVIKAYEYFLQGQNTQFGSLSRGILTFLIGVMALLMRQTNIFWVAVFMGGLELARSFHRVRLLLPGMREVPTEFRSSTSDVTSQQKAFYDPKQGRFHAFIMAAYKGAFHDLRLEEAGALGIALSIYILEPN